MKAEILPSLAVLFLKHFFRINIKEKQMEDVRYEVRALEEKRERHLERVSIGVLVISWSITTYSLLTLSLLIFISYGFI